MEKITFYYKYSTNTILDSSDTIEQEDGTLIYNNGFGHNAVIKKGDWIRGNSFEEILTISEKHVFEASVAKMLKDGVSINKLVRFVPNRENGELQATILLEQNNRVVLLCQDRIIVAALDGCVYRPYPETKPLDLYDFIQKTY